MKVKRCPFCGHQPDIDDLDVLYPTGTLWRYDPELELRTYHSHREYKDGDSVEEVVRKWENRE